MSDFFRPLKGANENVGTIVLVIWLMFTALLIVGQIFSLGFDAVLGDEPWQSLVVSFSSAIPVLGLALLAPVIYKRPIKTLVTSADRFRWRLVALGAAVWGGLLVVGAAVAYAMDPHSFSLVFTPATFIPMLLVGLIFIPIQISSEEVLFRGVITQALGRAFQSDAIVIALTTALFALPHLLNPEAAGNAGFAFLAYGAISFGWVMAARQFGGLEITLGAHLINNVFGILVVGYADAVVAISPIWITPAPEMNATAVSAIVTVAVWLGVLRWIKSRTS